MNKTKPALQNKIGNVQSKDLKRIKEFSSIPNLVYNTYHDSVDEEQVMKITKQVKKVIFFSNLTN
jgi:hypothetical protein